jgi:hypothetical protein
MGEAHSIVEGGCVNERGPLDDLRLASKRQPTKPAPGSEKVSERAVWFSKLRHWVRRLFGRPAAG